MPAVVNCEVGSTRVLFNTVDVREIAILSYRYRNVYFRQSLGIAIGWYKVLPVADIPVNTSAL